MKTYNTQPPEIYRGFYKELATKLPKGSAHKLDTIREAVGLYNALNRLGFKARRLRLKNGQYMVWKI